MSKKQEPKEFLQLGATMTNVKETILDLANELEIAIDNADSGFGIQFDKERSLPSLMRAFAYGKVGNAHYTAQRKAEKMGYEINTGKAFIAACDDNGISLKGARRAR